MDARYKLRFKKRRCGNTNYKKRYNLLLSKKPRMVIRITNKQIIIQAIKYSQKGDETIVQATSSELDSYGWAHTHKNISSAYLTGLLCAKRACGKKVKNAVIDFGLHTAHAKGRVFAAIKGVLDGGVEIPHDTEKDIFPDDKRIAGAQLKKDCTKEFEKTKENILDMKKQKEAKPKVAGKTSAKKTPKQKETKPESAKKTQKNKEQK